MATIYTEEALREAVAISSSWADVARHFGKETHGSLRAHMKKRAESFGIDFSHFKGQAWNKGKKREFLRKPLANILRVIPKGGSRERAYHLRRALVESGIEKKCAVCGLKDTWNGEPITLEVDHIDGDWHNNLLKNLRFICPNCHSQTKTYKNKKR